MRIGGLFLQRTARDAAHSHLRFCSRLSSVSRLGGRPSPLSTHFDAGQRFRLARQRHQASALPTKTQIMGGLMPIDLREKTPETWACIDCGINTAPGQPTRVEMEHMFNSHSVLNVTKEPSVRLH
jgi:hypothetical protein